MELFRFMTVFPSRAEPLRTFSVDAEIYGVWIAYSDGNNELRASRPNIGTDSEQ